MSRKRPEKTAPAAPLSHTLAVATLSKAKPKGFDLRPEADDLDRIATFLGIRGVSDLRFKGDIASGPDDSWIVSARLTGVAVQDCVVTLDPVDQKIDEQVEQTFIPEAELTEEDFDLDPDAEEDIAPYQDIIDLGALAVENLALALEPYPRRDDAAVPTSSFTAPGVAPLKDEDLKPFAGLAALKEKLAGK